jgi:hypothetical protein
MLRELFCLPRTRAVGYDAGTMSIPHRHSTIEPLEIRIAPAAVMAFIDVDGDQITIRTSKGTTPELENIVVRGMAGAGFKLLEIDFSRAEAGVFDGTTLTVIAKRTANSVGDGRVNVGYIDAAASNGAGVDDGAALNLGAIVIDGDLGQIDAGTGSTTIPAVKSLAAASMGRFGLTTQPPNASAVSTINGKLGVMKITSDVREVAVDVTSAGAVTIGGTVEGDILARIVAAESMGPVKVGGHLIGGTADQTGLIKAKNLSSITIGGSMFGGLGHFTGTVYGVDSLKSLMVRGSLIGGTSGNDPIEGSSGYVRSDGNIGSVTILGSVRGYEEILFKTAHSAVISAGGNLGSIRIGGDLIGGTLAGGSDGLDYSGCILANGRIGSVVIGGSIIAGIDRNNNHNPILSGGIHAGKDIGSLTVLGHLMSHPFRTIEDRVSIIAGTPTVPTGAKVISIGKIIVKGDVINADIQAGIVAPNLGGTPSLDAQIGPVTVGGDWVASNLTAGLPMIGSDNFTLRSRIASIVIRGAVLGDFTSMTSFKFSSEEIGKLTIGTEVIPLTPGFGNDTMAVGITGDMQLIEVT